MKKTFIQILVGAVALGSVAAGDLCAQSLSSVLIPVDPVAASLGNASVAMDADAWAVDHNAAAMSLGERTFAAGVGGGYWAPKTAESILASLGAYYRVSESLAVGLSGRYMLDQPMNTMSETGAPQGTVRPYDFAANLAVSYRIIDGLAVGVTAKLVSSTLTPDLTSTDFGADVSVYWRGKSFAAGAAVCNLGSSASYGGDYYPMPALVKAGGAWHSDFGLGAYAEIGCFFEGAFMASAGVEYSFGDFAFLRGGYHYSDPSYGLASYASLGAGAAFAGIEVNLAWLTASETLGNTVMLGVAYRF